MLKGNTTPISTNLNADAFFQTKTAPDANNATGNLPKAYLTIAFFNERFEFVNEGSVSLRVSQEGDNALPLVLSNIKAPKNGYAYVYLSNESNEPVYFDDFKVGLTRGRIIEENHFYAFGLKIAGISSQKFGDDNYEGELKNHYLYNDKELFEDADLNWYDYGFRNYDPQIGRFPQLDPLTDGYPHYTPYQYAGNEPIANVDLDGLEEFKVLAPVVVPGLSKSAQSASVNIFKLSTQIIPKISQITAVHSEQSLVKLQIQSFPPKAKEAPTFSQRQDYFVSDIQKSVNAQKTYEAGYNPDGSLMFWAKAAKNKTWNNFANNLALPIIGAALGEGVGGLLFRGVAKGIGSFFQGGRIAKASELVGYAEQQGWKAVQSAGGPLKYVDESEIVRMTIKQGSQRAAGSSFPHVELRNELGKRIDVFGNDVTRKGLGNHTEIIYDLK